MIQPTSGRLWIIVAWLLPALLIGLVWAPLLWKYRPVHRTISPAIVEKLRAMPDDGTLAEMAAIDFGWSLQALAPTPAATAEALLQGRLVLPGAPAYPVDAIFSAAHVAAPPPELALAISGFLVPRLLVAGYADSGDPSYLRAALDYVQDWAAFERAAVLPVGHLWTDHAIAARAMVIADLWRHYRQSPLYDPATAASLLGMVESYGHLLARPELYTVHSNHGVMQNLALMAIGIAFPQLPDAGLYRQTGANRFLAQMAFFVGDNGAVNEHSAGYQGFGVELMGQALRCLSLMRQPIPAGLHHRYERAKALYAQMLRPDGSLPLIGDTQAQPQPIVETEAAADGFYGPLHALRPQPRQAVTLDPVAGYLLWWRGAPEAKAQLALSWAAFPSNVHRHADQTSVTLWADGRDLVTNVGYWPYHLPGGEAARGWRGSNSPHLVGEPDLSLLHAAPLGLAASPKLALFDIERPGPGDFRARRQIIHAEPGLWLVLDSFADGVPRRPVETVWTFDPRLQASDMDGLGRVRLAGEGGVLDVAFLGNTGQRVSAHRGERDPFAGWVVGASGVAPAPSFVVEQGSNGGWSLMAARLQPSRFGAMPPPAPSMETWAGPEQWRLVAPGIGTLVRTGTMLRLVRGEAVTELPIAAIGDATAGRQHLEAAYAAVASAAWVSGWYRDVIEYRWRATVMLLVLVAAQVLAVGAVKAFARQRLGTVYALAVCWWLVVGGWLNLAYFS
jgi:hypothetical protein